MRIKFTQDAQVDGAFYKCGDDVDVSARIAEKLIVRGFAEVWSDVVIEAAEPEADDADPVC